MWLCQRVCEFYNVVAHVVCWLVTVCKWPDHFNFLCSIYSTTEPISRLSLIAEFQFYQDSQALKMVHMAPKSFHWKFKWVKILHSEVNLLILEWKIKIDMYYSAISVVGFTVKMEFYYSTILRLTCIIIRVQYQDALLFSTISRWSCII